MLSRRQLLGAAAAATTAATSFAQTTTPLRRLPGVKPRNIVFILVDDHRFDALGFLKGQAFLETPHLDRLAREGAHLRNAFVTTALCSPSRASILTGLYAHQHKIVDNNTPIPPGTRYFSEDLKQAGYSTAFIGKWHMGAETDMPQPGWDHWVSFRGQGTYLPSANGLNVDGKKVPQQGYITDELTDYAVKWLESRAKDKPYCLYLSHKAVHAEFIPAERHQGRYNGKEFVPPPTMTPGADDAAHNVPRWVRDQRNSWHGVEFPYHSTLDLREYYQRYAETLLAVDDSVGRLLATLEKRGELDSTLIVYMGDNGFAFGEHGLIDKRTAYEESMRVPMLARCPQLFPGGKTIDHVIANLDLRPTFLAAAGLAAPAGFPGRDFVPLLQGKTTTWRDSLLYEYYWERNFPQTPTIHALREQRYKYIHYHGVWDTDELFDLEADPRETRNLIASAEHQPVVQRMNKRLFEILEQTGGLNIPLYPDKGRQQNLRKSTRSGHSPFPATLIQK